MKKKTKTTKKNNNSSLHEIFINEALDITKEICDNSKLKAGVQMVTFFTAFAILVTSPKRILEASLENPEAFSFLLALGSLTNPLTFIVAYSIWNLRKVTHTTLKTNHETKLKLYREILKLLSRYNEYIIFPMRFIVLFVYFTSSGLRQAITGNIFQRMALMIWLVLDWISSYITVITKINYLRSLIPETDMFCKLSGAFEQSLVLLLPATVSLSVISETLFDGNLVARVVLNLLGSLMMLWLIWIYLNEMPFMEKFTEILMCQLLISFASLHLIHWTFGYTSIETTLQLFLLVSPICILGSKKLVEIQYQKDYLDPARIGSLKHLKRVYTMRHFFDHDKQYIEDYGMMKKYMFESKKIKGKRSLWKSFANMKKVDKRNFNFITNDDTNETQGLITNSSDNKLDPHEVEFRTKADYKSVFLKFDEMILETFKRKSRLSGYSIFLKIIWMLRNEIKLNPIYLELGILKSRAKKGKDLYLYEYANRQVSHILKGIYYHKDLYFENLDLSEEKISVSVKSDLESITEKGIDLHYALFYKRKMKEVSDLVFEFLELNQKFMSLVQDEKKSLRIMNHLVKRMKDKDRLIRLRFHQLHSKSGGNEFIHITPYFLYLHKCLNLHKSALGMYKVYKNRALAKRNFIDHNASVFTEKNFFNNMLIFLIDSSKSNFGVILDTYGKAKALNMTHEGLKGMHMNKFIMESHIEAHESACTNFMEQPLTDLIGDTSVSFIKIPNSGYVIPVTFNRKIVPFGTEDFNFIIGTKFLSDSNMYILIKDTMSLKIDSVSSNMKYMFNNPGDFLEPQSMILKEINFDLWTVVKQLVGKKETRDDLSVYRQKANGGKKSRKFNAYTFISWGELASNSEQFRLQKNLGVFEFKFKNLKTGTFVKKKLRVQIREKCYKKEEFSYVTLVLVQEDDNYRKWERKMKLGRSDFKKKLKEIDEKEQSMADFCSEISEEKKINNLNTSAYHFIKDLQKSKSDSEEGKEGEEVEQQGEIEEKHVQFSNVEVMKEKSPKKEQARESGEVVLDSRKTGSKEEGSCTPGGRVSDDSDGDIVKEVEAMEARPKSTENINLLEGVDIEQIDFPASSSDPSSFGEEQDSSDEEESENVVTRDVMSKKKGDQGTGSVFSTVTVHSHSRYYSFEKILTKTPQKKKLALIISIFIVSSLSLFTFSTMISILFRDANKKYLIDNQLNSNTMVFASEMQEFYSHILRATAFSEGLITEERYKGFYFEDESIDVSNISSYHSHKMTNSLNTIMHQSKEIFEDTKLYLQGQGNLTDINITAVQFIPNGSKFYENFSFYQGCILGSAQLVHKISSLGVSDYPLQTRNLEVLGARENIINGYSLGLYSFRREFERGMNQMYDEFNSEVIIYLFTLAGIMVLYMFVSIFLVIRLQKKLKSIYVSIQNMTDGELEERRVHLKEVESLFQSLKESNYYQDLIKRRDPGLPAMVNHSRRKKTLSDKNYCFGLLFSILSVIVFYSIKVVVAFTILLISRNNVETTLWISQKQSTNLDLLYNQIYLFNGIKQKLILGENTMVMNSSINDWIDAFNQYVKESSNKVYEFSEDMSNLRTHDRAFEFLKKMTVTSLCETTTSLKKFPRYCEELDDKIPTKGLIQSYLRVTQYLDELVGRMELENFDRVDLLNDKDFIELEYTFENVYYKAFLEIGKNFLVYIGNHLVEDTDYMRETSMASIVVVIIIALCFIMVSFFNLLKQIQVSVFSFQVLGIDNVIGNTVIKHRFLDVFEVRKRDF